MTVLRGRVHTRSLAISPRANNSFAKVIPLFRENSEQEGNNAQDDALLLERIAQRDHLAFATLVQRHSVRFFRTAYRFVGNRTEAEDVVQDAFLKLWERPGLWQLDRKNAFTTWFYRIIVNQCLDFKKKKRPLPLIDEQWIQDDRQTHEEFMIENEKERFLEKQIAELPERQRLALNLCFFEGLSNKEAASIMGIRLKALQALLMRAKTTLKQELKLSAGGNDHV